MCINKVIPLNHQRVDSDENESLYPCSSGERKDKFIFRHNPKRKKFNTFRAGIAKLHNMK